MRESGCIKPPSWRRLEGVVTLRLVVSPGQQVRLLFSHFAQHIFKLSPLHSTPSTAFFSLASLAPPPPKNDAAQGVAQTTSRPTPKAAKQSYMDRAKPEEDSRSAEYAQRMREMVSMVIWAELRR
jgi:hypothetical protein